MKPITPYTVCIYRTADGKTPFNKWHQSLDKRVQAIVDARIGRVRLGILGDCKPVGGVFELRIDVGPGYRVYFAFAENVLIVLLSGGNKSTQTKDIKKAKQYFDDYMEGR